MTNKIETSHAGSLPRSAELIAANAARTFAEDGLTLERTAEFDELLANAVEQLVARQLAAGITIPGDGEYGKAMSSAVDYGAWWSYSFQRTNGLEVTGAEIWEQQPLRSTPGNVRLTSFPDRRDRNLFAAAYSDTEHPITTGKIATAFPTTTGPLSYKGHEAVANDVTNLRSALDAQGVENGFITALSPGSGARIADQYYGNDRDHLWAWAESQREEYRAIVDGGLILQIDDPSIAENWDQINPEPTIDEYREFTQLRVDALNYALEGIDPERVRFHLCWGSWHGPHVTDIEFKHIADLMLQINAKYYSFEAANVRHEHEWKIWKDIELPKGKVLVPGIVSHATNVVEHPELVADRIENFANIVGPENVIASTDCGLGGRIHPDIAWAKLESLGEGAQIAAKRLFG
ncbi:cobalamin-independent methionine synthase II family protein [Canibacter zhoujuaniae]|uniref:cobalamin-independent methionine synthase II family protein n=1 Tax=Canibacter zhoujuaniae TaxID=2708343 RepID=UPI0014239045|nr:cobalamin-independent methionine synthase II family protein [Canibacter zhoujuaniae]